MMIWDAWTAQSTNCIYVQYMFAKVHIFMPTNIHMHIHFLVHTHTRAHVQIYMHASMHTYILKLTSIETFHTYTLQAIHV